MMKFYSVAVFVVCFVIGVAYSDGPKSLTVEDHSLIDLLEKKGVDYSDKRPNYNMKGVSAEVGKSLFHEGFAEKPDGGATKKQSKHFVCTSCHNVEREDPDLSVSDPQARLIYTANKKLPFLQGTTMYGVVNRSTYYNGDYYKKYGELVKPARNDIRGAIQLCAKECAQGRELKDWELESILAYLWTLELKLEDVNLDEQSATNMDVASIKSRYLDGSPATFTLPPDDREKGSGLTGQPDNGKLIYDNSCLHCHYRSKYSFLHLDDCKLSFDHLEKNIGKYSRHSLYQVVRWGVPVKSGKRSYMPQYTDERMSDQQLADLRAYIEERAS